MYYTLKNQDVTITIHDKGAELCSIKANATETEYLWTADATHWSRHAPNLFPIVGKLTDDRYDYNGNSYTMSQHGFARDCVFDCIGESDHSISFVLRSNEELQANYPFIYNFYVIYTLDGKTLSVTYKVENLSDDDMYFSVGAHPGFKCNGELEDYVIEFNQEESSTTYSLNADGVLAKEPTVCPFESDNKTIKVTKELFDNGVFAFRAPKSNVVKLRNTKTDESVTIGFDGFKYLGIWSPPAAPFVCLEPWFGIMDTEETPYDFTTKEGIEKLTGKETFECTHTITIK